MDFDAFQPCDCDTVGHRGVSVWVANNDALAARLFLERLLSPHSRSINLVCESIDLYADCVSGFGELRSLRFDGKPSDVSGQTTGGLRRYDCAKMLRR